MWSSDAFASWIEEIVSVLYSKLWWNWRFLWRTHNVRQDYEKVHTSAEYFNSVLTPSASIRESAGSVLETLQKVIFSVFKCTPKLMKYKSVHYMASCQSKRCIYCKSTSKFLFGFLIDENSRGSLYGICKFSFTSKSKIYGNVFGNSTLFCLCLEAF